MQTNETLRPTAARDFALPRPWLVTALLLASLLPVWALLRGLYLSLYFEPTGTALYAARVGHRLTGKAAVATLALLAIAIGIRWIAPVPSSALTAGIAVAITTVLGLVGLAWVVADRSMHPFGPERRALAAFSPPPEAEHDRDVSTASDHPEVARFWDAPGPLSGICASTVTRFEAWADPATVVNLLPKDQGSCYYQAQRGQHEVKLIVVDHPTPPGTVLLMVSARLAWSQPARI